jgi:hypothetical protein
MGRGEKGRVLVSKKIDERMIESSEHLART